MSTSCMLTTVGFGSKTTLKLPDDGGEIPKFQGKIGGLNPDYEISSLLNGKLAWWSTASYAFALARRPSISQKKKTIIGFPLLN